MGEHIMETIELELAILIRRTTAINTNKKVSNLDRSAYLLLHQLSSHGPAGVKALAQVFDLDISTVSRQAAALEQKGYVYRIPDPSDRRAYSFQIAALGTKELFDYKEERIKRVTELLKDWSEDESESFGNLLKKFNQSFFKS